MVGEKKPEIIQSKTENLMEEAKAQGRNKLVALLYAGIAATIGAAGFGIWT